MWIKSVHGRAVRGSVGHRRFATRQRSTVRQAPRRAPKSAAQSARAHGPSTSPPLLSANGRAGEPRARPAPSRSTAARPAQPRSLTPARGIEASDSFGAVFDALGPSRRERRARHGRRSPSGPWNIRDRGLRRAALTQPFARQWLYIIFLMNRLNLPSACPRFPAGFMCAAGGRG